MACNYVIEEEDEEVYEYEENQSSIAYQVNNGSDYKKSNDDSDRVNQENVEQGDELADENEFIVDECIQINSSLKEYFQNKSYDLLLNCISTCEEMLQILISLTNQLSKKMPQILSNESKNVVNFGINNFADYNALANNKKFVKMCSKNMLKISEYPEIPAFISKSKYFINNIRSSLRQINEFKLKLSMCFAPDITLLILGMITDHGLCKTILNTKKYYIKICLALFNYNIKDYHFSEDLSLINAHFGSINITESQQYFNNITGGSVQAVEELCREFNQRLITFDSISNNRYELMPNGVDVMDLNTHPHISSCIISIDRLIALILFPFFTDKDSFSSSSIIKNAVWIIISNFNEICSPIFLKTANLFENCGVSFNDNNKSSENAAANLLKNLSHGLKFFLYQCKTWYAFFNSNQYILLNNLQYFFKMMRDVNDILSILQNKKYSAVSKEKCPLNYEFTVVELEAICFIGKCCEVLCINAEIIKPYYQFILKNSILSLAIECQAQPNFVTDFEVKLQTWLDSEDPIIDDNGKFETSSIKYQLMCVLDGSFSIENFHSQNHILFAVFLIKLTMNPFFTLKSTINIYPQLNRINEIIDCANVVENNLSQTNSFEQIEPWIFYLVLYFAVTDTQSSNNFKNYLLFYKEPILVALNKLFDKVLKNFPDSFLNLKSIESNKIGTKKSKYYLGQQTSTQDDFSVSSSFSKSEASKYKGNIGTIKGYSSKNSGSLRSSLKSQSKKIPPKIEKQIKSTVVPYDAKFTKRIMNANNNYIKFLTFNHKLLIGSQSLYLNLQISNFYGSLLKAVLSNVNIEQSNEISLPSKVKEFFDDIKYKNLIFSQEISWMLFDEISRITDIKNKKGNVSFLNNSLNMYIITIRNLMNQKQRLLDFASVSFIKDLKYTFTSLIHGHEILACIETFGVIFCEIIILCLSFLKNQSVLYLISSCEHHKNIFDGNIFEPISKTHKDNYKSISIISNLFIFIGEISLILQKFIKIVTNISESKIYLKYKRYIDLLKNKDSSILSIRHQNHIQRLISISSTIRNFQTSSIVDNIDNIPEKLTILASLSMSHLSKNIFFDSKTGTSLCSAHNVIVGLNSALMYISNSKKSLYEIYLAKCIPLLCFITDSHKIDNSFYKNIHLYFDSIGLM